MSEQTRSEQPAETTFLDADRRIDLSAISLGTVAWLVVAIVAIGVRLIGRANWPLSPGESSIARDAWALLQGNELSSIADAYPAIVQLTGFVFFLFGDTDYTARLIPLAAGVGLLLTLYWLRSWFGNLPALSVAIVWAISPVMAMSTMRLDGGAVLALASLLTFALTLTLYAQPEPRKAVTLGIAVAIGLTAHPLGWITLPLAFVPVALLIRDIRIAGQALPFAGSFLATLLLVTSWFGTRITAVPGFFTEGFSILWDEHIVRLGAEWPLPILVLLVDEPLVLLLAVTGVVVMLLNPNWNIRVPSAIYFSAVAWALPLLAVGLLLSGKGTALYAVSLFPLIVVAGFGLSILIDGARTLGWNHGQSLLWGIVAIGLLLAVYRTGELLAAGPEDDALSWIINVVALALLILLPLSYITIRMTVGTGWRLVPIALLVFSVLFGGLGLRTTLLLPTTSEDRPGEILRAGTSTPAVGAMQQRLRSYSRDVTAQLQSVQDPTGGHGLMIAIQQPLDNPFAWYFRDFPNLVVVNQPEDIPADVSPDAIIAPVEQQSGWDTRLMEHQARTYATHYSAPEELSTSTYEGLLISTINPLEYGNLFEFAVRRSNPALLTREESVLWLREDHAEAIWGGSPEAENLR